MGRKAKPTEEVQQTATARSLRISTKDKAANSLYPLLNQHQGKELH
jgi:hypothetical protein